MSTKIDEIAQKGFSDANAYDTHRPSYPPEAVSALLQKLEIDNGFHARIVDLAAGTGKFTELLAGREEEYKIIAVEPHDGMRGLLEAKQLKRVSVVKGMANDMKAVERGWADAAIVAQVSTPLNG
jgi:ubiquinone/menaquinone biosynthesis C-methylase UbiE